MRILITGVSGFLGSHLAEYFIEKGYKVFGISRKLGYAAHIPKLHWKKADIISEKDISKVLSEILPLNIVIHNAGVTFLSHPDGYWMTNALGTYNIVCALQKMNFTGRFIHISSLAAAGPGIKKEDDECNPINSYGKSKRFAEKIVINSSLNWCILRPPVIFGERDYGLKALIQILRRGFYIKATDKKISIIYAKNVACAAKFLIESENTREIYFIKDADLTFSQFSELFYNTTGLKQKVVIPVNNTTLVISAKVVRFFNCITNKATIVSEDKVNEIRAGTWVAIDEKIRKAGWKPEYPWKEAFKKSLVWYLS